MNKSFVILVMTLVCFFTLPLISQEEGSFGSVPVAYQGRFLPAQNYVNQWLYLIASDTSVTADGETLSASDILWKLHFHGHSLFDTTPLFWIEHRATKEHLGLDSQQSRFSYTRLKSAVERSSDVPSQNRLVKHEIDRLSDLLRLFERLQGDALSRADAPFAQSFAELNSSAISPKEVALELEQRHPLAVRLSAAGNLFMTLPSKFKPGEWYSLQALKTKAYHPATRQLELVKNFTPYPDTLFTEIREHYFRLEKAEERGSPSVEITSIKAALADLLTEGYRQIAGTPYTKSLGKQLYYPSLDQLKAEFLYAEYPLTTYSIAAYLLALVFLICASISRRPSLTRLGFGSLFFAFVLHTTILALRCYILGRPPVTNMFETVLYVPWIAVLMGLLLRFTTASLYPLMASAFASALLLLMLRLNFYASSFENVQAVLDSHYWLLIHVLMVVGSYGLFLLASVLGHIYLIRMAIMKVETASLRSIAASILQILYAGLVLLIAGTVLGGMWAAQSWGRFWDWDPKESWAFISICIYLLWIHAYRFGKIASLGLAIGSVIGFIAISFTWYGVNYILGTGLHSYGFGNGGIYYYYGYLFGEVVLLVATIPSCYWLKGVDKKTPTC